MTRRAGEPVSVKKEIVVEAPQERAFRVFTEGIGRWWPREHHIGKAELKEVVLEPRVGGRWFERGVDGSECLWGKVLVYEPPRRVVLAWQINAQWQYDETFSTEVEVLFSPEGPKRTRVELEHRDLERFGDQQETIRKAFESGGGWAGILAEYQKLAAGS
ncbi:ATPase [Vitiosangium sp. GDMCC 1.1324]|nr:ATPase [Vitiosangium sp. GDMCC 1.1324]